MRRWRATSPPSGRNSPDSIPPTAADQIAALQGEISALEGRQGELNGQISSLQSDYDGRIAALQGEYGRPRRATGAGRERPYRPAKRARRGAWRIERTDIRRGWRDRCRRGRAFHAHALAGCRAPRRDRGRACRKAPSAGEHRRRNILHRRQLRRPDRRRAGTERYLAGPAFPVRGRLRRRACPDRRATLHPAKSAFAGAGGPCRHRRRRLYRQLSADAGGAAAARIRACPDAGRARAGRPRIRFRPQPDQQRPR